MSTLTFPRRSRAAERFAELVDLDSPRSALDGGNPAMRPAVVLTAALRSAALNASPAPLSAEARLAMRQRLVAAASAPAEASLLSPGVAARAIDVATRGQERARVATHRMRRRMTALAGSVVVLTSITGVGVAAAKSLPGDPFYDLKRATESVQLWLASGATAKGERHLEFARTRLAEARDLSPTSSYLASTLSSMNAETRAGSSDLLQAYRSSGNKAPLQDLVTFTHQQYVDLVGLGRSVPQQLKPQTFYSMQLLTGITQEVRSLGARVCLTCVPGGNGSHPTPAPGSTTSPKPQPTPSAGTPTPQGSSPGHPTQQPTGILPTGLIPTNLIPTLPPLSGKHNGKHRPTALPTLTPLPLLSTLFGFLSGR